MSQSYSLPHSRGRRNVYFTAPGENAPINLDGKAAWDIGDVLQGIMDVRAAGPIDVSSYNSLRPVPGSSPSDIDLQAHAAATPSWRFVDSRFNGDLLEQHPGFNLTSTHQQPWSPVRVTGVAENAMPRSNHERQRSGVRGTNTYMSGNCQNIHSDLVSQINGPAISDPGYGTRSPATTSAVSSFQIEPTVHPSIIPSYGDPPHNYPLLHNQPTLSHQQKEQSWQGGSEVTSEANETQFSCDVGECGWTGKCQSDKKKHMLRHQKRFRCEEQGCSRTQGFGTVNDLERHQKCIHGIEPKHGNHKEFKCFAENCSKREKIWPRYDNFKQHLKRMHKDEDTDRLIQLSLHWFESIRRTTGNTFRENQTPTSSHPQREVTDPTTCRSRILFDKGQINNHQSIRAETVGMGNGAVVHGSNYPLHIQLNAQHFVNQPFNHSINSAASSQNCSGSLGDGCMREGNNKTGWDYPPPEQNLGQCFERNGGDEQLSSFLFSGMGQGQEFLSSNDSVTEVVLGLFKALGGEMYISPPGQLQEEIGTDISPAAAVHVSQQQADTTLPSSIELLNDRSIESRAKALRKLLTTSLQQLEIWQTLQDAPPQELTAQPPQNDPLPYLRKGCFQCRYKDCTRETERLSEMKKHEKRHYRPYGCTYPRCFKKFGSKDDWKRHENTRHFQIQCWRCPERGHPARAKELSNKDETLMERPDHEGFPVAFCMSSSQLDCARIFDRAYKFSQHLQSEHSYDEAKAKVIVKENKIGRNGQFKFWCGFCRKLISLHSEGLDAWDERFHHIDNKHFKMKEEIATWLHPEGHLTKQDEEKENTTGNASDDSEELERYGDEGTNSRSCDGGEEPPEKAPGPSAPTKTTHMNVSASIQRPSTNSNLGRPRRSWAAVSQIPTRKTDASSIALPTKRTYDSVTSGSFSNASMLTQPSSSSDPPAMIFNSQQTVPAATGPRRTNLNNLGLLAPNNYSFNLNGLIPIENKFPESTIITCVSPVYRFTCKRSFYMSYFPCL
ncbi:hypothetical protein PABG_00057 [Paracoccidioides brasiliensis Pb03]|nr:hypothetical protein PABG_00057 [Paracoccidioides brasiliensis Pb03]